MAARKRRGSGMMQETKDGSRRLNREAKTHDGTHAGLHGTHVMLIYDEASAIPDKIWEVSEGAMKAARKKGKR